MQTQWRVGQAGVTGLDYTACRLVAGSMRLKGWPRLLEQLQVMEAEVLRVLAERRDRK